MFHVTKRKIGSGNHHVSVEINHMEFLVTKNNFEFNIDKLVDEKIGLPPLLFQKMDKSKAPICMDFLNGNCEFGDICPHRHINKNANTVCKHYLNGLCKKGDLCEFLHAYDMSKMADCQFNNGPEKCTNEDCIYNHRKVEVQSCPWYERGFCKHGPNCKLKHEKKILCNSFLNGFCLEGENCQFSHPIWFPLPNLNDLHKQTWICRHCNGRGHKIQFCNKLTEEEREKIRKQIQLKSSIIGYQKVDNRNTFRVPYKPDHNSTGEVVCFTCGVKGHKSNVCPHKKF